MRRRDLAIILLLYGVTATAWAWLNPVFEAPDEPFHVGTINLVAREHRLPDAEEINTTLAVLREHVDVTTSAPVFEDGQWRIFLEPQASLYYVLQAAVLRLVYPHGVLGPLVRARPDYFVHRERGYFQHEPGEWRSWSQPLLAIRLMRALSVALGIATVWVTFQVASLVMPHRPMFALLAAGIHAFIPMFTFMTATINNDALAYLASGLVLWLMTVIQRDRWPLSAAVGWLGVGVGLAWLSKATTLLLWPLSLGLIATMGMRWWSRLLGGLGITLIAWGIRIGFSAGHFGYEIDKFMRMVSGASSSWLAIGSPFLGHRPDGSFHYIRRVLSMMGESFWGSFGWYQIPIHRAALVFYWLGLVGAAVVGGWGGRKQRLFAVDRPTSRLLVAAVVMGLVQLALMYSRIYIPQGGRYLLVIGMPLAIFLSLGLFQFRAWIERAWHLRLGEQPFTWGVLALVAGVNWWVLWASVYQAYRAAWARYG